MVANDARTGKELWRTWTIAKPGEPGDETWGDVPWEKRKQVGTWMPPSYDPELKLDLLRHVRHRADAEVSAGRERQDLSLPHLDARARRRHRQDRVALPAHRRPLGLRPHVRSHPRRHRRSRPTPATVAWINPKHQARRSRKVLTGIPGKTGIVYTLDRRTGEFLWADAHREADRRAVDRRRDRQGHR